MINHVRTQLSAVLLLALACSAGAQTPTQVAAGDESILVRDALAIQSLARGGRSLIVTDPVEASIARGTWSRPVEVDDVSTADGRSAAWQVVAANEDGQFTGALARGYLHVVVRSDANRIMMLHARGHRHAYINGVRRGGDVYNLGITAVPIELRQGENELLLRGARGRMRIELRKPESDLVWLETDHVKPNVIQGGSEPLFMAVPIANASNEQLLGVIGETWKEGSYSRNSLRSGYGAIPPLGVRKVGAVPSRHADLVDGLMPFRARAVANKGDGPATVDQDVSLTVREREQRQDRTFISAIDGSVQYYAVMPRPEGATEPHGMILTLHGASVQARRQAGAYGPKSWATVVAPTNRRPFGFDWEDWGRIDAMEVFEHAIGAAQRVGDPMDPSRRWLTGHSMGGHGTWQVGAHFAPLFAAIGPSAGWRDFWSYGGAGEFEPEDPIGTVLNTANNASRTLLLERNYEDLGVYILHGDNDNNVPVSQARFMREWLSKFHPDFAYYEQPGAGHWWGNRCVDWPPMMRFFEERSVDPQPARERFSTVNPAINGRARLTRIVRQAQSMSPTTITCVRAAEDGPIEVSTENVLAFELLGAALGTEANRVVIDGQEMDAGATRFVRDNIESPWESVDEFDPALKGDHRAGPFKHAFDNNMVFVYATGGTEEENAWALAKARYDADVWQYRANGSVDVVPDTAFELDDPEEADRSVILYGCADSHGLWDALLAGCPIRISRGRAQVGDRERTGSDIAAHFAYPRPGSDRALVGVIAATGAEGRRTADPARYFISGVGYPDWLLTTPAVLETGLDGVVAAGFFGPDWSLDWEQSGWR
ncbi:MAG: prolyl oligopeptidase family serine peptidase [Phycisphaerales bacterium]